MADLTYGSVAYDASYVLCSLTGTVALVRDALANGTAAIYDGYQWHGRHEDIIVFSGNGTTMSVIYKVKHP